VFSSRLLAFPFLFACACVFEMPPSKDPYKAAKIIHYKALSKEYKAAAKEWESQYNIIMKHLDQMHQAMWRLAT
jgi:hypothetical protein